MREQQHVLSPATKFKVITPPPWHLLALGSPLHVLTPRPRLSGEEFFFLAEGGRGLAYARAGVSMLLHLQITCLASDKTASKPRLSLR
jgi:hypothetical protein